MSNAFYAAHDSRWQSELKEKQLSVYQIYVSFLDGIEEIFEMHPSKKSSAFHYMTDFISNNDSQSELYRQNH
jgi:hypothetical protein